jgi:Flp pilus assembly protein TadD
MKRSATLLICTAVLLLAPGCASVRGPLGTAELERALRERGLEPSAVVIPFAITEEMRVWAKARVPANTPHEELVDKLLLAMMDSSDLRLKYEVGRTATAREAFETGRANCLAFTSLFVGLARELGAPVFYLDVEDVESFEKDGDLMVVSGHVSAGFDMGGGKLKILDFAPDPKKSYRRIHRVSDVRAIALFYSNRGAESLRAGNSAEALGWLRKAVEIDPGFGGAWVNLGVALRREGDVAAAEAAYRKALEVDPRTSSAYSNLASILRVKGRNAEAEEFLSLAADLDRRNPYSYLALGDLSLAQGRLQEAQRFYRQALRRHEGDAEIYASLGLVALASGNAGEARKWLRRAEARDRDNERVRRLGNRLSGPAVAPRSEG